MTESDTVPARDESAEAQQVEDVLALSPLQEGLYALSQLAGDGHDVYTMPFIMDIEGPLDAALLRRCAEALLRRHPNLRAAFWDEDLPHPVQIVPSRVELPWTECAAQPEELDDVTATEIRRPFDLSRGPALRIMLVRLSPADGGAVRWRMVVTIHHILMDGWSLGVFLSELRTLYEAEGDLETLPPVRPYRDYIGWLADRDTSAAQRQWVDYLSVLSGPLMIAGNNTAAGSDTETAPEAAAVEPFVLPATEMARLRSWAREQGVTLNTVVQFAWTVVLARLTDRRDVAYGTVVTGRPEHLPGVERMIGLFLNTVPVAFQLDPAALVPDECARLQRESAAMRDVGYLGLSSVQRATGHSALFDTLFVVENAPMDAATKPATTEDGVTFRPVPTGNLTHYPLTVVAFPDGDELMMTVEAVQQAVPFRSADIGACLLTVLSRLPDCSGTRVGELDVLSPLAQTELLREGSTPALAEYDSSTTIFDLFEQQVIATPDALALTTDTERLTYRHVRDAAVRLAGELTASGVGAEDVVALYLPRSYRALVAILATLAAGAAYVPVDITLPTARTASIFRQARPRLVLTEEGCGDDLDGMAVLALDTSDVADRISRRPANLPPRTQHPRQGAYMIFTSGSTGEPKGVVGTHEALVSYFVDHRARVYRPATARLGRKLRIAHAWSLSFDASWQPLVGLLDGHCVHLFDSAAMGDAQLLVDGIGRHGVDMIDTTPSVFRQLAEAGLLDQGLGVLALGGEAIDGQLWSRLAALPDLAVHNCYGPTETTVEAVVADVTATDSVDGAMDSPTIGAPTAGMSAYVLDSGLRLIPEGAIGELYLSGQQLARGYAVRPGATASSFVADPFRSGRRMYRTGDLVRSVPGGGLAYLGRADDQVKIRGYRIEVGEVEATLRTLPGVAAAAATVVRRGDSVSLVGFVVGESGRAIEPAALRTELVERLPAYMVPARIVVLARLPVNANNKLDVGELARLAEQSLIASDAASAAAAPSTDTERVLSALLTEVFDAPLGVDDDLFAHGLDSIVAISLVNKARKHGLVLSPRMVLASGTIRDLAAVAEAAAADWTPVAAADEYGEVRPLPIVSWMYEHGHYRRFTLHVLITLPAGISLAALTTMVQTLLDGHASLRSTLVDTAEGPRLATGPPGGVQGAQILQQVDTEDMAGGFEALLASETRAAVDKIDPRTGDMMRAVWFRDAPAGDLLFLTVHHLAIDVVSWQILLAELSDLWDRMVAGAVPEVAVEATTYRQWSQLVAERAHSPQVWEQRDYWAAQVGAPDPALGWRKTDPLTDTWSSLQVTPAPTAVSVTADLLSVLTKEQGVRVLLLAALTTTLASWRRERGHDHTAGALVALESHGRAETVVPADTSGTVGWFTSVFPIRLGAGSRAVDVAQIGADPTAARALLDSISAHIEALPADGLDFGLLQQQACAPELIDVNEPQVAFNYLGRMDLNGPSGRPWSVVDDPALATAMPIAPEPDLPLRYALDVVSTVNPGPDGPQLMTLWRWSDAVFETADVDRLIQLWNHSIAVLVAALDH